MTTERQAWLDSRRTGIGGSDLPAILGLDPNWDHPLDVYRSKVDGIDTPSSPAAERGQRLEPIVAKRFADETGYVLGAPPKNLKHWDHPACPIQGNPDYLIIGRRVDRLTPAERRIVVRVDAPNGYFGLGSTGVLEIKTTHCYTRAARSARELRPTVGHAVQTTTYMGLGGWRWGYLVVAIGPVENNWAANEIQHCYMAIPFSQRLFSALEAIATDWWRAYVLTRTPPTYTRHPQADRIEQIALNI